MSEKQENVDMQLIQNQEKIRILVDVKSLEHGTGAPDASLQLMKTIRERYKFSGVFELIPIGNQGKYDEEGVKFIQGRISQNGKDYGKVEIISNKNYQQLINNAYSNEKPTCTLGFTGAYDRDTLGKSQEGNILYDNGINCGKFYTLSTQGWLIYQDNSSKNDNQNCRMGPNVYSYETNNRQDISVHLPRKDVLALEEKSLAIAQSQKKEAYSDKNKPLKVILYKLDQPKNLLTKQREMFIKSLTKYAAANKRKIEIIEATGVNSKPASVNVNEYLTLSTISPNLSTKEYHKMLAESHAVFCEGQSTGSQAMLYGTVSIHIPLHTQGVSIHASNNAVQKNEKFKNVFSSDQQAHTIKMADFCAEIRKGSMKEANYDSVVEYCLGKNGQELSLSVGNTIYANNQLDMLSTCISTPIVKKDEKQDNEHQKIIMGILKANGYGPPNNPKMALDAAVANKNQGYQTIKEIFPKLSNYIDPSDESYLLGRLTYLRKLANQETSIKYNEPTRIKSIKNDQQNLLPAINELLLALADNKPDKNLIENLQKKVLGNIQPGLHNYLEGLGTSTSTQNNNNLVKNKADLKTLQVVFSKVIFQNYGLAAPEAVAPRKISSSLTSVKPDSSITVNPSSADSKGLDEDRALMERMKNIKRDYSNLRHSDVSAPLLPKAKKSANNSEQSWWDRICCCFNSRKPNPPDKKSKKDGDDASNNRSKPSP